MNQQHRKHQKYQLLHTIPKLTLAEAEQMLGVLAYTAILSEGTMTARHISQLIHLTLIIAVLGWGLWGAYTFWAGVFGSPFLAVGALLVIEAACIAGMVLYWLNDASPLIHLRHAAPVASAIPTVHSLHAVADQHVDDTTAWLVASVLVLAIITVTWMAWAGLGRTIIDPDALELARREHHWRAEQRRREADIVHVHTILAHARRLLTITDTPHMPVTDQPVIITAPRTDTPPMPDMAISCVRCGAPVLLAGRSAKAVRAATGRYGCPACQPAAETGS